MPEKVRHFCWHFSRFSLKLIGLSVMVLVFLAMFFVWRVSTKPLDIGFAKDFIASALKDPATGNYARMQSVVLHWPDLQGPLYIQLYGGELVNQSGNTIISVDTAAISFSRRGLLTGRILPKSIVLRQPTLRMTREADGNITMDLGQDSENKAEPEEQMDLTSRILGYIARPGHERGQKSLIGGLEEFSIENARLFVDDKMVNRSWSLPDFNIGFKSTYTGMQGYVDVQLPDVGLETPKFHAEMDYVWDRKTVEVMADLRNIDLKALAGQIPELSLLSEQNVVFDAHFETILDEKFLPEDIRIEIKSKGGEIMHPDVSDDPIPYTDLSLNAFYNYFSKSLILKNTKVTLKDVTVNAKAELKHTDNTVTGPVTAWIDALEQEKIDPLWPKVLRGDNSETWIVQRLSDGVFDKVTLSFDVDAKKQNSDRDIRDVYGPVQLGENAEWVADVRQLIADFSFSEMSVDYRSPLDSVNKAYGSGRFDMDKDELFVEVEKGYLGSMAIEGGKVVLDQIVAVGRGDADIAIKLDAKVQDVMRYISKEPINLGDDLDMDIDKVKGNADLDISLRFPARGDVKIEDFNIGVTGILNDVLLPDVVQELDLSGGPLKFAVKDGLVSMVGKALIEKRPVDLAWEQYLNSEGKPHKEKVTASLTVDPNIREMMGIDLSDFIEGSLPVKILYKSFRDGRSTATVDVDATPALFFVDPFDYEKQPGVKANAKFFAELKNGDLQKITDLTASGGDFDLSKSELYFKTQNGETVLSSGTMTAFKLQETVGTLKFAYDDQGAVKIVVDASVLDARPFMDTEENAGDYDEPPMQVSVSAAEMLTAPEEKVTEAQLYFDIDGQGRFNQMEMDGNVGNGGLFVRYKPDEQGKRTFRLKADDAGAFLKAFQVYQNIRGGTMVIYGEPVKGVSDRNLNGLAEISDFKVVKAPVLTKLLSVLSLAGIGEVLGGDGLHFDKLESKFSWLYRKGGSLLVLEEGRTSGNSLGLLFDGTFDKQKSEVDVSGTVVPMSTLNEVIGNIPIIGDILTGGSGGVFAATYSITGKSDDPQITVNPLSILTPGILRRILWEKD